MEPRSSRGLSSGSSSRGRDTDMEIVSALIVFAIIALITRWVASNFGPLAA